MTRHGPVPSAAVDHAVQCAACAALEPRKRDDNRVEPRAGTPWAALRTHTRAAARFWLPLLRCALVVALTQAASALALPPPLVKTGPFYAATPRAAWPLAARTAVAALVLAASASRVAAQTVALSGRTEGLQLMRRSRFHHRAGSPAACGARPAATDSACSKGDRLALDGRVAVPGHGSRRCGGGGACVPEASRRPCGTLAPALFCQAARP